MSARKPRFVYCAVGRFKFRIWPRWWTQQRERRFAWLWWTWAWWDSDA